MGKKRFIGIILILASIACFIVNFWAFFHLIPYVGSLNFLVKLIPGWLSNPLSLLTPSIVGNVWLVSSMIGSVVNGVFAVIWSVVLFFVGLKIV